MRATLEEERVQLSLIRFKLGRLNFWPSLFPTKLAWDIAGDGARVLTNAMTYTFSRTKKDFRNEDEMKALLF